MRTALNRYGRSVSPGLQAQCNDTSWPDDKCRLRTQLVVLAELVTTSPAVSFAGADCVVVVSVCRYEEAAALLGDMEAQHGVRPDEFSFAGLCVALQQESDLGGHQVIAEALRINAAIAACGRATSSLLAPHNACARLCEHLPVGLTLIVEASRPCSISQPCDAAHPS